MDGVESLVEVVTLRDMRPSDRAYVLRTWVESYAASPIARALTPQAYGPSWSMLVERQLERSKPRIACLTEATDAIVGFAVIDSEAKVVHYVAVRDRWRRKGVASMLLSGCVESTDWTYSHQPPSYIVEKIPAGWRYAPLTGAGLETER